ncbi:MAG: NRDE family protein [Rhodospirillaceae bacterium]|nr:NRDE family protein [Rhodospirillaceae bacterium]
MCTVVLLRRPDHPWPILLAANRDEMMKRPWKPPARHWPDRANVVAGIDLEAGGSWLGANDAGVVAAILNRPNALGPAPNKRSRGELVLEALDSVAAADVIDRFRALDGEAWKPFNMVIADRTNAYWLRNRGSEAAWRIEAFPIAEGLSMITARELNDTGSNRIRRYLERFRTASTPDPDRGEWKNWQNILGDRERDDDGAPDSSMNICTDFGFGTVSSSLIAVPAAQNPRPTIWLFSPGQPDLCDYEPVSAIATPAAPLKVAG